MRAILRSAVLLVVALSFLLVGCHRKGEPSAGQPSAVGPEADGAPEKAAPVVAASPGVRTPDPEDFDFSGLPAHPTSFLLQKIEAARAGYHAGNMLQAETLQQYLAQYYTSIGDTGRAADAALKARVAGGEFVGGPALGQSTPPVRAPSGGARASAFSGRFLDASSEAKHEWTFSGAGTFVHSWHTVGPVYDTTTIDEGTFVVAGKALQVHVTARTTTVIHKAGAVIRGTVYDRAIGPIRADVNEEQSHTIVIKGAGGREGVVIDDTRLTALP